MHYILKYFWSLFVSHAAGRLKMIQEPSITNRHFLDGRLRGFPLIGSLSRCITECSMDSECVSIAFSSNRTSCQLYKFDVANFTVNAIVQDDTIFFKVVCERQDYTYIRYLNLCMRLYYSEKSLNGSMETCKNDDAHLLRLDTVGKMDYLKRILNHIYEENIFHIERDFFVAGTENVAIGLVWLIGYMVTHTEVQEKCRKCVTEALGDKELPDMEDVNKMTYLEATVQEVLRLANIAPLSVPHAVQEEVSFEDFIIPKDTMVLTHLQSVHLDTGYWDDPETFNPDRFIAEDGSLQKKEAFYPYSIGPRYFLAMKLAQMELLLIFSTLLKYFKFTDGPPSLTPTQPGAFVEPKTFCVTWTPVQTP